MSVGGALGRGRGGVERRAARRFRGREMRRIGMVDGWGKDGGRCVGGVCGGVLINGIRGNFPRFN